MNENLKEGLIAVVVMAMTAFNIGIILVGILYAIKILGV